MRNYHLIRARYIGGTSTMALCSMRFGCKKRVAYDYEYSGIHEQSVAVLSAMGYTVIGRGETSDGYMIIVEEFRPFKEIGG